MKDNFGLVGILVITLCIALMTAIEFIEFLRRGRK